MDNIQVYLDKLGLDLEGSWSEDKGYYFIPLKDSNEFSRVYTKLDNADWLNLVDGDLTLQAETSSLLYINDDITFNLKANFTNDDYSLIIREEV